MSRIDDLIANYERFVALPWQSNLAPAQKVWMAVYSPDEEKRLRLHLQAFETASRKAGYGWGLINISDEFEKWMVSQEYRESYFANPEFMKTAMVNFFSQLIEDVKTQLRAQTTKENIVGLVGASSLYGLGEKVKLSALVEAVQDEVKGRLLVFFPGEVEGDNYRLLDAKDGWNYHATLITAEKGYLA
jgi:hypothetical protein